MNIPLITTEIRTEADVVLVRQTAKRLAALLQFDLHEQTRIATAVSEVSRNAFSYARGGRVQFSIEGTTSQALVIRVSDTGPGIANLEAILEGKHHASTGVGVGLVGAKRLMDSFRVSSSAGGGTTVELGKVLHPHLPTIGGEAVQRIAAELDRGWSANALDDLRLQNVELLRALDDLRTRQLELDRMYLEVSETNRCIATANVELEDKADALQISEARFRAIFETAEVSIWDADFSGVCSFVSELHTVHGRGLRVFLQEHPSVVDQAICLARIRDVNPATVRLLGAANEQELTQSLSLLLLPETLPVFLELLVAVSKQEPVFASEASFRTLDGRRLDVAMTVVFPSAKSVAGRAYATLVDISARKAAETEREARVAEMERALQFSETFVGILGHDLRNPLNAITAAAGVLQLRGDENSALPARRIASSAARMSRMITQMLDFTRIRLGGGLPLDVGSVDLKTLAQAVIDEVAPFHARTIRLDLDGDTAGMWDRDRLSQLLSNLAANACQHGTRTSDIWIALDGTDPDRVRITVCNGGVIPSELLPSIFEPLRSGDVQGRGGGSGLGLGLYITDQIARAHGGEIEVESSAVAGTRFTIDLPRRQQPDSIPPSAFQLSPSLSNNDKRQKSSHLS